MINSVILRAGKPASPRSLDEFQFEPGIAEALEKLRVAGLRCFVISNQPDVARGLLDSRLLEQMNDRIAASLPIESIEVCPHDDGDNCRCRKPQPGMIEKLALRYGVEVRASFVVGDSWRDMGAAHSAGCAGIIIDRHYNRNDRADYRVKSLGDAAKLVRELLNR